MKKVILTLAVAFSTVALSAQTLHSASSLTSAATESVSNMSVTQEKQVKNALLNDDSLQSQTLDYLKSDPETATSVAKLATKSSDSKGLMQSILGDKSLSSAAIDFITSNPELLSQAMKFVGM